MARIMNKKKIKISLNKGELIVLFMMFFIGLFFFINAIYTIPVSNIKGQPGIGPRAFPLLASGGMIFFTLVLIVKKIFNKKEKKEFITLNVKGLKRVLIILIALFVYYFITPATNFIVTSILFLLLAYWISGYSNKKMLIFLPVIIILVLYYVFHNLLSVPLP